MEEVKQGPVPRVYQNISLEIYTINGLKRIEMSKMSALGLESLLGSYIVRYKGQSDWITADLVKLSDGLHLEAMRLEAKFSPPKQVPVNTMPQRYHDIRLRMFNRAGFEELVITDITQPELQHYFGGPTMLVCRRGKVHWTLFSHMQLYDGIHLEVREFGDKLSLDAEEELQRWEETSEDFIENFIDDKENPVAERAVEALVALGGTNVHQYRGPHRIRNSLRDTRYPAVLEIHGAAICEEAVFLVDDILHLTGESLVHHIDRSDMLQLLAGEEALPQLQSMKDKTFLGAVAAQTIAVGPDTQERVLHRAAANKIELWLPEGIVDGRMHALHKHKPFRAAPRAKLQAVSMRTPKRTFVAPRMSSMRVPFTWGMTHIGH